MKMKRSNISSLTVSAELPSLNVVLDTIRPYAKTHGTDDEKLGQIELVIEEILVNIINYGYPESPGEIEINYQFFHEKKQFVI